jgi:N-acetylglutamate synthase-like GNAT family acetyltransferase
MSGPRACSGPSLVISIRLAGESDLGAILALDAPAAPHEATLARLAKWISAGQFHIAQVDGLIVGYGVLTENFFGSGFVEALMVGASHRRQAVGTAIMRHFLVSCPTPKLWTSTNLSNLPMQRLLAKEGFTLSGVVDNIDPGDPELFYLKRRDQPVP